MSRVQTTADIAPSDLDALLAGYGLIPVRLPDGAAIAGSYWGEPEAGIAGMEVRFRADTPVHSVLHEAAHTICMSADRRALLAGDAGGDDLEECAVCYLQLLLAERLAGVGQDRLMQDMDRWGYSFRLGSTRRWFTDDASDARNWLLARGLITRDGRPTFRLRC